MTEAQVRDIAARHGLAEAEFIPHPSMGVDNHIWFLGSQLVLRAARDESATKYMRGEIEVWPFVHRHGVRTPEVVAIGEQNNGLPYMLVRRVYGRLLGECPASVDLTGFVAELVEQLATLHGLALDPPRRSWYRPYDHFDPWPFIRDAHDKQLLPEEDLREIEAMAGRLQEYPVNFVGDVGEVRRSGEDVLTHNDLHPWNLMVAGGELRLVALLDWGDACVSDLRNDFCTMPLALQIQIAEAYREAVGSVGEAFEARCLWGWLDMALWELRDLGGRGFAREWMRWPEGGWPEAKEILARAPEGWHL